MVQNKNILICSKSTNFGGEELHILDLIKSFSKTNKIYIASKTAGVLQKEYIKAGATFINLYPKSPFDLSYIKSVYKFCKNKNIDVLHAHDIICSQSIFSSFIARVKKRIFHVHTPVLMIQHPNNISKLKHIPNWCINFLTSNFFSTDVLCLTNVIKKHRLKRELIFKNKLRVIPNVFYKDTFKISFSKDIIESFKLKNNIPTDKKIIGNISQLSDEKGHIHLFDFFKKFVEKNRDNFHLLICSKGPNYKEYLTYCEKNLPSSSFTFLNGFIKEDHQLLLNSFDYFIHPTLAEGFGFVALESLASGVPTYVSDLPVLREVLGSSVNYFNHKDSNSIYNVFFQNYLQKNNSEKNKIIESIFDKYSLDKFKLKYSNLYS